MRVVALVGKTGTGKSYQCIELAREENIESIIDDGLLISGNKILAGKSAKHETTKMASVKRAIFANDQHVAEVKSAIERNSFQSILILGTSEKMVKCIAERLSLPPIEKVVYINEIATPDEIETASFMRNKYGKHVIPAPVLEVKKQFSGYFLKSLILPGKREWNHEKTVMRPSYSYLGSFKIAPRVISDICRFELCQFSEITRILKLQSVPDRDGCIEIFADLSIQYPCDIPDISKKIQKRLSDAVENSTSITVKKVNVTFKNLTTE